MNAYTPGLTEREAVGIMSRSQIHNLAEPGYKPAGESMLSTRAMLARPSIAQWSARKLDKKTSHKVTDEAGAQEDAARVTKSLVASEALETVAKIATEARAYHMQRTLPWLDDGARLLPVAGYPAYVETMREHREKFESAVRAFVAEYDSYVASAPRRLGALFDPADYPEPSQIIRKFSFTTRLFPVPTAADWRVDVSEESAAILRADVEAQSKEAMNLAVRDAYERIAEAVGAMAKKLADYKPATEHAKAQGVFRDSLVDNVRSLAELLPVLNITGDKALAEIAARIASELTTYDAEDLRKDDGARYVVAERAAAILADVSAFMA